MKTNTERQVPIMDDEEKRQLRSLGLIAKWVGPNQNIHAYIKRDGVKNFDFDAFTYDNVVLRNVPTVADMLKWKTAMDNSASQAQYNENYAKLKALFNPKAKKVGYSNRYGAWEVIALRDAPDTNLSQAKVISNDGLIHVILRKGKIQQAIDMAIEVKPLADARRDRLQHQLATYMPDIELEETNREIDKYELKLNHAKASGLRQKDIKQKLKELYAKRERLEMPQREDNELLRNDDLTSKLYMEDYDAERSRNREPNVKPSACRNEDLMNALSTC